ncbi:MAG: CPBP family intramembrane metalloprotease [Lachnospiraceae bacterium]|nr:CPBP family intramembrane metalloprotease [Lachnospiraceae bacterium]
MKSVEKNKELIIYITVAYGVTFLMGILMWYGNNKNIDLGIFPNAQMFYPAAGVMMAVLCTRKNDAMIPKVFYVFFICVTVALATLAVISILNSNAIIDAGNGIVLPLWSWVGQLLIVGASIVGGLILLATKKEKRRAYGLCWNNGTFSWFCIFLFLALYIFRTVIAELISGEWAVFGSLVKSPYTWLQLAVLPVNFFLLYTAFFGEEYGWRYYLQPLMQKRFGVRGGVLLLGVVWGIWHLPVDLFYYTQNSQLPMVLAQQITCITLGIFFAYAYMKTNNIWIPVVLHYLNNNLIPIISNNYTFSVLENQTVTWGELLVSLMMNGVIFGSFLYAKPFRRMIEQ